MAHDVILQSGNGLQADSSSYVSGRELGLEPPCPDLDVNLIPLDLDLVQYEALYDSEV